MSRPTCMSIDLVALSHNFVRVLELAKGKSVIAMVKANAYGHGIVNVAKTLSMTNELRKEQKNKPELAFGVASLEEAIVLRESGVSEPIILMEGIFHADELIEAQKYHFSLVVHHLSHVECLENFDIDHPFPIWLKINTGMNRLGINPQEIDSIYQRLMLAKAVKKPIGLMTHFAEADDVENSATKQQINLFNQKTAHLKGPVSLANSAAILAWPESHGDWVRPGLMLYGASPFPNTIGIDHQLRPVMTLVSKIIAITHVKKGGKVGYGATWVAPQDMPIGVVGVGYGDGYPQFAKNGTPILVNGVQCSLVGRVSMDMLTVDLRNQANAKIGDPVVLWGDGLPVEYIAKHSNTSPYEILTRMTPRPRIQIKFV